MNLLDLGIIIILLLVVLRGYYRGLFQEISVIVGLLGGLLAAAHLYKGLAVKLGPWIKDPLYGQIIAFVVILVIVYWLARLIGYMVKRALSFLYLGGLDRVLGGAFALAKGMLVLGLLLTLITVVVPKDSRLLQESTTAPYLKSFYNRALKLLPPEFMIQIKTHTRDFEKQWNTKPRPKGDDQEV
jgi:membrane protein required for colicin V production